MSEKWIFSLFAACIISLATFSSWNSYRIDGNAASIRKIEALQKQIYDTQKDVTTNRLKLLENAPRIEAAAKDRYHKADHDKFVEELKRLNPSIKLP